MLQLTSAGRVLAGFKHSPSLNDINAPHVLQEVRAYEDKFYTPLGAARHGFLDDIIWPSETRQRLIRELRLLKRKNIQRPWKKHGNIPL